MLLQLVILNDSIPIPAQENPTNPVTSTNEVTHSMKRPHAIDR